MFKLISKKEAFNSCLAIKAPSLYDRSKNEKLFFSLEVDYFDNL